MTEQREKNREQQQGGSLQSGRGTTRIEDNVVARVAGIAAQEIEGVKMGGGGAAGAVGNLIGSVSGSGGQTRGVSVEVGREEAAVDLVMTTEYGKPIPQLAEAVRRNVISRIESLVGLRVKEVNIEVADIYFPQEEQEEADEESRQIEQGRSGRVQ
ncbi:MAG: Asp23/Gls24 family envelope stress response protein [Rubrobacteraceae bacterium]|uniref:Asp23/Gls24 family envelope stress response protein n=1 Tax=Rubrobacter naiadicus TaxID=1392641 RepID=UPI00235DFD56|nr:Asp23/Gls24 family envelope stress response protein [Rubrobacter naiadicus]MBX6762579.1 Asp23/Gls24 family envelope stress response protein [Rubrobacteraceae bacterium]MCL6438737.1 Asp23/Gls24 family envelope stress response protein [Rubrobacteraceae bacterium]